MRSPAQRFGDHRVGLGLVVAVAAALYFWDLGHLGSQNFYYLQAVTAGSQDWSAAFFGSLDSSNFITVDKPPLALWVQVVSVRAFGSSSWAVLVPQALIGLATIGFLYDAVRRTVGRWPGVVAAAVLAFTPVTVALARSNMPDPMLILCLTAAGWFMVRALDDDRLLWPILAFVAVGVGFQAKMLQAWIVVPALVVTYVLFGPTSLAGRLRRLVLATAALVVVSFSWPAAVSLWPGDVPYIGGSTDGSVLDLVFGYNGFGRVFGQAETAAPGAGFDDGPGVARLFNVDNGHQASWMLPAALVAMVVVAVDWFRHRRSSPTGPVEPGRAAGRFEHRRRLYGATSLWGLWVVTHVAVFSSAQGIYHPYYTSAMAPGVAALVAIGVAMAWERRSNVWVSAGFALVATTTGLWFVELFDRADWNTWVGWTIGGVVAAVSVAWMIARRQANRSGNTVGFRWLDGSAMAVITVALIGAVGVYGTASLTTADDAPGSVAGLRQAASPGAGPASFVGGGRGTAGGALGGQGLVGFNRSGANPRPVPGSGGAAADGDDVSGTGRPTLPALPGRGVGDPEAAAEWLLSRWDGESWIVAVSGSFSASDLTVAADGAPVMTMGGFMGQDPTPTAEELDRYVETGRLRYVIVADQFPLPVPAAAGADEAARSRTRWVEDNCRPIPESAIDGLHDCRAPTTTDAG